jgi:hypothetical protein
MVKIEAIKVLDNYKIWFEFNDNTVKTIDFTPFLGEDDLTKPLSNPEYFRQVKIYENGRGIYWPNDYDVCPDFIRRYEETDEMEMISDKKYDS